jgi:hypothetical protein
VQGDLDTVAVVCGEAVGLLTDRPTAESSNRWLWRQLISSVMAARSSSRCNLERCAGWRDYGDFADAGWQSFGTWSDSGAGGQQAVTPVLSLALIGNASTRHFGLEEEIVPRRFR